MWCFLARWWLTTLIVVVSVCAQEKREPPRRQVSLPGDSLDLKGSDRLPKIDLPEFVITGKEIIDLPVFSKTSVDEYNVFDAATRTKGPGYRESTRVELGGSPKEQIGFSPVTGGFNGKVIGGYGSFQTPYFDGWFGKTFSTSDFLLKAGFTSSGGHIPNADFRKGYSGISGGFYLPEGSSFAGGGRLQGNARIQGATYRLFGSRTPDRRRTLGRFASDISFSSTSQGALQYVSAVHLHNASLSDSVTSRETILGIELNAGREFKSFEVTGGIGLWSNSYSAASASSDPYLFHARLSVRHRVAGQLDIVAGGSAYLFQGSDTKRLGRAFPMLGVLWYTNQRLTLSARFEPYVRRATLFAMVEDNPYLFNDVRIRHPEYYNVFSLAAEGEISNTIRTRVSFDYTQVRSYPMYSDPAFSGVWTAEYFGNNRLLSFNGDIYLDIAEDGYFAASLKVRGSRNSRTEESIPYYPALLVSGLYTHRFGVGLAVTPSLQVIGKRFTDVRNTHSLPSYALLSVEAEYPIVERLTAALVIHNLLDADQRRFDGYAGLPRTLSLGVGFSW